MGKPLFNFDAEFRLGIEDIDRQHQGLVDMLNEIHRLISEGQRPEARRIFNETLSRYVEEHFMYEEEFMESISFPQTEEHRRVHANFKKSFQEFSPRIASDDQEAFRQALSETFTWIINHIGRTDRKYASYYFAEVAGQQR